MLTSSHPDFESQKALNVNINPAAERQLTRIANALELRALQEEYQSWKHMRHPAGLEVLQNITVAIDRLRETILENEK